ncbi:protein kinase domain containing protein [Chrysochromulina tobinii]|uniref:Protein kinase domain containing protein n=1 Tax=Chrysochromulina tobinii TaxID=1460289 RepID=A0A0M0JZ76_9EUKA|nr:protein kinase domain containing protein [Chrysochromulina tobinii]|eukprot:KOO31869.1 protein kinase domain containing protein [Chrysochromulina sp. CCMP291]
MRMACCKACELYAEAGSQKLSVLDDDRLLKAIAWSFAAVLAAASCIYWPATRRQILNLVMFSHGHQQHAGVRQLDGVPFDHYRVLQELGAGAFGTVSLVERVSDGKAFAAKEVLYSRCEHDVQWKAALDEVSVWTALCSTYHPSILQLVEVVHVENVSLHLVTELMSGGELAGALDHILMTEQNVRMINVQIAAAIAHLHLSHSMAHRDIKPQNVLCRWRHNPMQAGCLSLADFGFCARFRGSPKEPCFSLYAGSMDYFAPELALIVRAVRRKEPQEGMKYSAAVDCYALGCVVYQMFHGSTPHFSADEDEQLDKIVEGGLAYPREPFGQVSSSCLDFVQKLLEPDQQSRMTIEEAMRHKWLRSNS